MYLFETSNVVLTALTRDCLPKIFANDSDNLRRAGRLVNSLKTSWTNLAEQSSLLSGNLITNTSLLVNACISGQIL